MSGYKIGKEIDPVAVVALLIAVVTAVSQLYDHLVGANLKLFTPAQVELRKSANGPWFVVHAQMSYVNTGGAGYNGVIEKEYVKLAIPAKKEKTTKEIELAWQSFVTSDPGKDEIRTDKDAHVTIVNGASASSHQTAFYPRSVNCNNTKCNRYPNHIKVTEFLDRMRRDSVKELEFTFYAKVYGETEPLSVSCTVKVDTNFYKYLSQGNYPPSCWRK